MLLLKVLAARTGSAGKVHGWISDLNLPFEFTFSLPDADIIPIDGKVNGGTYVTIAAKGWGPRSSTIASFSELESSFKGSPATVDSFVSGSYSHVESRIEAVVIVATLAWYRVRHRYVLREPAGVSCACRQRSGVKRWWCGLARLCLGCVT